jgi:hypothetical protein
VEVRRLTFRSGDELEGWYAGAAQQHLLPFGPRQQNAWATQDHKAPPTESDGATESPDFLPNSRLKIPNTNLLIRVYGANNDN